MTSDRAETQIESLECPYCGEWIDIVIDCSVGRQKYIEDCSVCCRPIVITTDFSDGEVSVVARSENE